MADKNVCPTDDLWLPKMSDLREQLEQAKAVYKAVRYPGNLADDLADRQHLRIGSFLKIVVPLAAAACVAVIVFVQWRGSKSSHTGSGPVAIVPTNPAATTVSSETADVVPIAPALPITPAPADVSAALSFPTDLPTSPGTAMTTTPSPPAMPSWSDAQNDSSSTL